MSPPSSSSSSSGHPVDSLLESMDWKDHVGQMAQIDVNILLNDEKTELRQDLVDHYIGVLGVGSVLNNIANLDSNFWKISDFRQAAIQIQQTAQKFNRPPVIWGLDSVHGANYLIDTITTPQPINLAASFNTTLSLQAGDWASRDTRRAGITWLFSPLLGLAWQPIWSRVYETFGEDPVVVGAMAKAMIQGIQQDHHHHDDNDNDNDNQNGNGNKEVYDNLIPSRAAACAKHWVGYSMPHNGHDRAPSWIPTRHLYQYFLLPWKQVLDQVDTVMESYTEIDGVPNAANRETLVRILRQELNFDGMLVTDYHEIFNLFEWHHTASDRAHALQQSLQEGSVDMSMIATEPDDYFTSMEYLVNNVTSSSIASSVTSTSKNHHNSNKNYNNHIRNRIKESARRVLQLKYDLNMFEESFQMTNTQIRNDGPSEKELQAALEMTYQTITLVKNNNMNNEPSLPLLERYPHRVLVTGPTSNSLSFQTGGWTGQWQGINSNKEDEWFTYGSTVLEAIRKVAESDSSSWQVTYECGVNILGQDCGANDSDLEALHQEQQQQQQGVMGTIKDWVGWGNGNPGDEVSIERAMKHAADNNIIIVCLGEENYTEKPGDIRSLALPLGQYELVAGLREAAPESTIILVYFGGRPRLLANVVDFVDAVLIGFLPGPLAGQAVADLLTGRANPSAKLPITYPKFEDGGGIPYLHSVSDMCTNDTGGTLPHFENVPCDVQWPFGHGLSYTKFKYENLSVSTTQLEYHYDDSGKQQHEQPSLTVSITVENTGIMAGSETVLFFTFDEFRSVTPEYKRLRGFEKVWLEPATSTSVSLTIPLDDLRFIGPHDETHYILEDGLRFQVGVGAYTDCRRPNEHTAPLCSPPITISTGDDYVGACEAACNLWKSSGCSSHFHMTSDNCWDICTSIHQESTSKDDHFQLNNDGWGWNYVKCLESITWEDAFDKSNDCWKLTTFCRDVLSTPNMDEFGNGPTPNAFAGGNSHTAMAIILATIAGLVASALVAYAMRGGCARRREERFDGIAFSNIRNQDIM